MSDLYTHALAKLEATALERWQDEDQKEVAIECVKSIAERFDDEHPLQPDYFPWILEEWGEEYPFDRAADLLDWYAEDAKRIRYMDEAISLYDLKDAYRILHSGMALYAQEAAAIAGECFLTAWKDKHV